MGAISASTFQQEHNYSLYSNQIWVSISIDVFKVYIIEDVSQTLIKRIDNFQYIYFL